MDDEYVEGDSGSEAASAPGEVPADDVAPRGGANQHGIDSSSTHDAPTLANRRGQNRTAEARKAFAAAVLANKDKPAPVTAADEFDPEAPAPIAAKADVVAAKAKAADAPAVPVPAPAAAVAPPAPSLDPEVRKLRETLAAERQQLAAERAELEKARTVKESVAAPPDASSIEAYLDNAPSAVRNWLESMRGDKLTDDDFKSEVADLITMLSGDVLGVPLPENVRIKLEAAQAKKMVRTHKTIQTRKEQEAQLRAEKERVAATEKAEIERVEQEWTKASQVLSQQFTGADSAAAKAHPWLAAEDEPGKIIVDVIRAAVTRDGTQLSWQEAAKQANDYLKGEAEKYYTKRKPLLTGAPAVSPVAKPAAPVAAAPAAPVAKPTRTSDNPQKWSREKHMEATRAAFRAQLAKPE